MSDKVTISRQRLEDIEAIVSILLDPDLMIDLNVASMRRAIEQLAGVVPSDATHFATGEPRYPQLRLRTGRERIGGA